MIDLSTVIAFEWDEGNARKNDKHSVTMAEAEQVFFNEPLVLSGDSKHSAEEPRFHALGRADGGRLLQVTFTLRAGGSRIRVISARGMHRKERVRYGQET